MKKTLHLFLVLLAAVSLSFIMVHSTAMAASEDLVGESACKDTEDADCAEKVPDPALSTDCRTDSAQCNPVTEYVNPLINTLAAMAGIAVVIGIIVGGIQYASSGGDPQKAASGKGHIKAAIIALVCFFFLYAFLQFVIPGGILKR